MYEEPNLAPFGKQSIVEAIPMDGSFRGGYAQAVMGLPSS